MGLIQNIRKFNLQCTYLLINNTFSLPLPSAVGQEIEMELLDMRGKIVCEKTLLMQNESMEIAPNVAQGMYSLHLLVVRSEGNLIFN